MKFFKLDERAQIPTFATEGSACFDVRAFLTTETKVRSFSPHNKEMFIPARQMSTGIGFQVQPGYRCLIPTGLIFNIPTGHVVKMHIRSSMAVKNGIILVNQTGIIDSDYVDEVFIPVYNVCDTPVWINAGERIAQAALERTITYTLEEAKRRPYNTTARQGGIGSTGTE